MSNHTTDDNDERFQELLDELKPAWPKVDQDEGVKEDG